jgi:hypothetical protein
MIFQQHPKQEIARIVPLIGDCCAWRRRRAVFLEKRFYIKWLATLIALNY